MVDGTGRSADVSADHSLSWLSVLLQNAEQDLGKIEDAILGSSGRADKPCSDVFAIADACKGTIAGQIWHALCSRPVGQVKFGKAFYALLRLAARQPLLDGASEPEIVAHLLLSESHQFAVAAHSTYLYAAGRRDGALYSRVIERLIAEQSTARALYLISIIGAALTSQRKPRSSLGLKGVAGAIQDWPDVCRLTSQTFQAARSQADLDFNFDIGSIAFVARNFSPLPNNTGTKILLDYAYSMLTRDRELRVTIIPFYDNAPGLATAAAGTYRPHDLDLELLFKSAGYDDFYKQNSNRITLDDRLRAESLTDFEAALKAVGAARHDLYITTEHAAPAAAEFFHSRGPILYVQVVNGMVPRGPADVGLYVDTGHGQPTKPSRVTEWEPVSYVYGRPPDLVTSSEESCHVLTVGKDLEKRLNPESLSAFGRSINRILASHPHVRWSIIGSDAERLRLGLGPMEEAVAARLEISPYESNLPLIFGRYGIFALPKFRGGGRVAAWAAMAKLPLVVFAESDAVPFAGPQSVVADYDAFTAEVTRLIADPDHRRSRRAVADAVFESSSVEASMDAFITAAQRAVELGSRRLGASTI